MRKELLVLILIIVFLGALYYQMNKGCSTFMSPDLKSNCKTENIYIIGMLVFACVIIIIADSKTGFLNEVLNRGEK